MGDWSYLSSLLDKVHSHSTVVGKVWMSVLLLFRIFVLGAAADKVWSDEVSEFYCDTLEPGCVHACYNWMFPLSYVHYWVFHITFVTTPTLVYLGHAIHVVHKAKRTTEHVQKTDLAPSTASGGGASTLRLQGVLFCTYMTQLVFKIFLEILFSVGQLFVFGPVFVVSVFHCTVSPPCPRLSGVQCYVSRPTEKTIFILFMLAASGVSVFLNVCEIIYLLCSRSRHRRKKKKEVLSSQAPPTWKAGPPQYGHVPLSVLPRSGPQQRPEPSTVSQ